MTPSVSGLLYCGLGLIKSTIETQMKHKTTISLTPGGDFYHPEHTSSLALLWSTGGSGSLYTLTSPTPISHQDKYNAGFGFQERRFVCSLLGPDAVYLCILSAGYNKTIQLEIET